MGVLPPLGFVIVRDDFYAEWNPQRGHSLLDPGVGMLRPVAFSAGAWKSLHPINWGFARARRACG